MATMSEDGDITCPLCAEEMDLTDQQLKACKCGYEICVWCWHHIMDMAEKDDSEGRCPACRTQYDKERIAATTVNFERMVAEVNADKKQKSHKAKTKTSAERKHLSSVRVVQKNLVYITGLPIDLSDESLLERKEYFGQYGKVLKVSISRLAGATAQHASSNNTFSVYITYDREEEAIQCIQSVHNFVLEGKPLRACFGTTKYCHAWLRNMTCSNPDCLYLHDIASQEDSFSKDEIISAYTRSRVPQIASANLQRRFGNSLPPLVDDFSSCVASSKAIPRSTTNNGMSHVKSSNCNSGKSTVLPATASWGLRSSNCRSPIVSMGCSQTPIKQKVETPVIIAKQASPWDDDVTASSTSEGSHEVQMDILSSASGPLKSDVQRDCQTVSYMSSEVLQVEVCASAASAWDDDVPTALNVPAQTHFVHVTGAGLAEPSKSSAVDEIRISGSDTSLRTSSDASPSIMYVSCASAHLPSACEDKETGLFVPGSNTNLVNGTSHRMLHRPYNGFGPNETSQNCSKDTESVQTLCSGTSSVTIDRHITVGHPDLNEHSSSGSNSCSIDMAKSLMPIEQYSYNNCEGLDKLTLTHTSVSSSAQSSRELSDWSLESQKQVLLSSGNKIKDPSLTTDDCRRGLSPVDNETCSSYFNYPFNVRSSISSLDDDVDKKVLSVNEDLWTMNVDKPMVPVREDGSALFNEDKSLSTFCKTAKNFELPQKNFTDGKVKSGGPDEDNIGKSKIWDTAESSIISDILSLDFDPWDDSLASPNDFAKLLGETTKDGSPLSSTSFKPAVSSQSRFSFARQENQLNHLGPFREIPETQKFFSSSRDSYGDVSQKVNGFNRSDGPYAVNRDPVIQSNGHAGPSRSKISAPPGFSSMSKAPPGFSFQDRREQAYGPPYSENNLRSTSLGNQYQVQQSDNVADVEFIDPAILAVGRGQMPLGVNNASSLKPAFSAPYTSEADLRLQLLMQQSISSHQRQRIPDHFADRFLNLNDAYSIPHQPLPQYSSSLSPFVHPLLQQSLNNHTMHDSLRNERFMLNNYYTGSEEFKFRVPNADLYSRSFGL